jgi:hypothetical protein
MTIYKTRQAAINATLAWGYALSSFTVYRAFGGWIVSHHEPSNV